MKKDKNNLSNEIENNLCKVLKCKEKDLELTLDLDVIFCLFANKLITASYND